MSAAKRLSFAAVVISLAVAIIWVFPVVWMAGNSFRPNQEILAVDLTKFTFTMKNYQFVLRYANYSRYFFNSLVVAIGTTVLTVVSASLCAYSLTRFNTGGRLFDAAILATRAVPPAVRMIPFFLAFSLLGLTNSLYGLVLAHLSFNVPMAIWLVRGFLEKVPVTLEEAALIDGCTRLQALRHVLLPVAAPGLAVVAILTFIYTWNEFLISLVLASGNESRTLPVAASMFVSGFEINWGPFYAAGTLILAPVLILTFTIQRFIVEGLTLGAVKG